MLRWLSTLKFKIAAISVASGVLSAIGSTYLVLGVMQENVERLLLQDDRIEAQRDAAALADKLDVLRKAVLAVARHLPPGLIGDAAGLERYMLGKPALQSLFDSLNVARVDGKMVLRVEHGATAATHTTSIADREYFKRALLTDDAVVSDPIMGRLAKVAVMVVAARIAGADDRSVGVLFGGLQLQATGLLSSRSEVGAGANTHQIVIDRAGKVLAHRDASRLLGRAADEPGLQGWSAAWHGPAGGLDTPARSPGNEGPFPSFLTPSGGGQHMSLAWGHSQLSDGYLRSTASVPGSDWLLVRLTPQALAFQPVAAAQRAAWPIAFALGLVVALLAGALAWHVTQPIARLHRRAENLLSDDPAPAANWPEEAGEVGDLARAFQHVVLQRERRQAEVQALVQQMQAVFDHADIGIALSRNGQFELVSRQFCQMFRCEKQHAVGQSTRMISASDAAYEAFAERARPAFMEFGAFDSELELMRRNGQTFWAHLRGRAVVAGDMAQGTIWIFEDVTAAREQRERLTWAANHDTLTGLANRASFEVLLEQATETSAESPFCALFVDLDRFKQVNDAGGHAAGDALLRDIARELSRAVRKSDTLARLGGDEFAVLLPGCPLHQAQALAEKLRQAVAAYQLVWEGQTYAVGASIGLVPVGGMFATAAEVLRAADAACYAAKRGGRNRVAIHGDAPPPN